MIVYTLKVINVIRETTDTCTICFKQPGLKKIKYIPGQYITVTVSVNGRKYKRPYSLSSAPGIDSTLNITVKRLQHGVVSNHLVDVVKVDDLLEVTEPMGKFVYKVDSDSDKEIFLWGAGSGVTPLMSILKTALTNSTNKVNLFYCNKTTENTIFYDKLVALKNEFTDRFNINLFCTEEQNERAVTGRINTDHVSQALVNVDIDNTLHYICGPEGLKQTVKAVLAGTTLSQNQLFSEDFEHIINDSELGDIQTQFVWLRQNNQEAKIEVVRGKSILEAGLDSGFDLPYSCQTGSCTLCKATLISGSVKKISNEKMDKEIAGNEELLCCSYPLTENVKFEIN
jgi:ring-1,2-phenylacetyl-CoA epoxidase subunit PaaE